MFGISIGIQLLNYFMGICIQKEVIQTFRQWTFIQYFLLGGMLPVMMPRIKKTHIAFHATCLIVICVFIPFWQLIMKHRIGDAHAEYFYDDILTIIWVLLLFSFIMRIELSNRMVSMVNMLAPLIMGIYILHVLVIKTVVNFWAIDSFDKSILAWGGVFFISAIGSFVFLRIPVVNKIVKLR